MIFNRIKVNEKHLPIADKIVEGYLFVNTIWEPVKIKEITWTENPYNDRTWCFYLHSLDIVGYLMSAYEQKPNDIYLEKAKYFIQSWIANNPSPSNPISEYAWKDHSTANRVTNIIVFLKFYMEYNQKDQIFIDDLKISLGEHGNFLYDDKNYTFKNNHGIFQDRALLELAVLYPNFTNSHDWFQRSVQRLVDRLGRDIADDGVHKEHSGSYHILVFKLYREINEFLGIYKEEYTPLKEVLFKMEEYLAYLVKPNKRIPMTGDSGPDVVSKTNTGSVINPKLGYVLSNGEVGEKPDDARVFPHGGAAFLKKESKNTYLNFIAAFHSLTHKHCDDLSFSLSVGNTDYFVDSGKYNYKETDDFRKYFRSAFAHNTITVGRKSYLLDKSQVKKSFIENYGLYDEYRYVVGVHKLYPGVTVKRTIIHLYNENSFIIHDELLSKKIQTYSQIFNIGKDVKVSVLSKKKIELQSKIDQTKLELLQINHVTEFKEYNGNLDPIAGWQSDAFNKKHAITQLQFSNKGDELEYKTIINTSQDKGFKNFMVKIESGKKVYTFISKNSEKYTIELG